MIRNVGPMDLQRQNNVYDALGRLLSQAKNLPPTPRREDNDVHLNMLRQ